jgi:hypothetical protein
VQNRFLIANDQCVAGIVPTLEADHSLCVVGQPVHDLTLTLVTPLGTDDDNILSHVF